MSEMTRGVRRVLIAAAIVQGALLGSAAEGWAAKSSAKAGQPAEEAGGGPGGDGKAAEAQAARRAYDAGLKAFASGRHQNAIDQLNVALRGGGLGTAEMAKGLYVRGAAYRKLNKPSLAISDLTSALWLKNGLSDADRTAATAERAEAYKAAGIAESGSAIPARQGEPVAAAAAPSVASSKAAPAPAASAPAFTAAAGPASEPGLMSVTSGAASRSAHEGVPQPLTLGAETAAPPAPRVRGEEKVAAAGAINHVAALEQPYGSAPTASVPAAPAEPILSAAPMDTAPAPTASVSGQGVGSAISGFFSNLFSGSSTAPTASVPMQTELASTPSSTTVTSSITPQTSSWQGGPSVTKSSAAASSQAAAPAAQMKPVAGTKVAAVAPTAAMAPVPSAKTKPGKFTLHIAAVRSRAEADALAQRLNAEHGAAFADRSASVDEAVIGSMGTFYRVRVGGYKTADEPRTICNKLRSSGYDCLVVTN